MCFSWGCGPQRDTQSQVCGVPVVGGGGQGVQEGPGSSERVVPQPGHVSEDLPSHGTTVGAPVCHSPKPQAAHVHFPGSGCSGVSCRRPELPVGGDVGVCVPAHRAHGQGADQDQDGVL